MTIGEEQVEHDDESRPGKLLGEEEAGGGVEEPGEALQSLRLNGDTISLSQQSSDTASSEQLSIAAAPRNNNDPFDLSSSSSSILPPLDMVAVNGNTSSRKNNPFANGLVADSTGTNCSTPLSLDASTERGAVNGGTPRMLEGSTTTVQTTNNSTSFGDAFASISTHSYKVPLDDPGLLHAQQKQLMAAAQQAKLNPPPQVHQPPPTTALKHQLVSAEERYELKMETEILKSELQRLKTEQLDKKKSLIDRIKTLENEIKELVQMKEASDNELHELSSQLKHASTKATVSDDKFNKLRNAYLALRQEHLSLLQKGVTIAKEEDGSLVQSASESAEVLGEVQDRCRMAEQRSAELQSRLTTAEERLAQSEGSTQRRCKETLEQLRSRILEHACQKASMDIESTLSCLNQTDWDMESNPNFLLTRIDLALGELDTVESIASEYAFTEDMEGLNDVLHELVVSIGAFTAHLNETIIHGKSISKKLEVSISDKFMAALCTCGEEGKELLVHLGGQLHDWHGDEVVGHAASLLEHLSGIRRMTAHFLRESSPLSPPDTARCLNDPSQASAAETLFDTRLAQAKEAVTSTILMLKSKSAEESGGDSVVQGVNDLMFSLALLLDKIKVGKESVKSNASDDSMWRQWLERSTEKMVTLHANIDSYTGLVCKRYSVDGDCGSSERSDLSSTPAALLIFVRHILLAGEDLLQVFQSHRHPDEQYRLNTLHILTVNKDLRLAYTHLIDQMAAANSSQTLNLEGTNYAT